MLPTPLDLELSSILEDNIGFIPSISESYCHTRSTIVFITASAIMKALLQLPSPIFNKVSLFKHVHFCTGLQASASETGMLKEANLIKMSSIPSPIQRDQVSIKHHRNVPVTGQSRVLLDAI